MVDSGRLVVAGGALVTLGITNSVAKQGLTTQTKGFFALCIFVALIAGFISVPWVMIPGTIVFFVALPALKVFVTPTLGGLKDVISFAAIGAAALALVRRRAVRRPLQLDVPILMMFAALLALYLVNTGGLLTGKTGYGSAWLQGTRLFNEPLALFFVGFTLREPERTLRATRVALIATAFVTALYGLFQQVIGVNGLVRMGYTYGVEVRQIGTHLRSFGTFDNSFVYASFLLLALAVVLSTRKLGRAQYLVVTVISLGLLVSYVRTAVPVAAGILGLALARRGQGKAAVLLGLIAVAAAGIVFFFAVEQRATRTVTLNPTTYVTLNGRTKLWTTQIGKPSEWAFGQGVGAIGTAALRARQGVSGKRALGVATSNATVDSGYLTLVADIGFVGLLIFVALLGRIALLGRRAAAAGYEFGWLAMAGVLVMAIDALSRESFTAFPTPYVGMLLLGLACAASMRAHDASAS